MTIRAANLPDILPDIVSPPREPIAQVVVLQREGAGTRTQNLRIKSPAAGWPAMVRARRFGDFSTTSRLAPLSDGCLDDGHLPDILPDILRGRS